jgi:PAS domain S-box-containing protein
MTHAQGDIEASAAPSSLGGVNKVDQAALDAIPIAVCVCTADSALIRYNRRAVEIWGRAPRIGDAAEQSATSFRLFAPDGDRLSFAATPVGMAMRTGERVLGAELFIERPDGTRIPVLMNVAPMKDTSGSVIGAVCGFQEFTERKLVEQALRESEAELQSVINRTPFMLVRCSRDMRYRFISQAYAQWIGQPRDEVVGKTIAEALGDDGFAVLRQRLKDRLSEARDLRSLQAIQMATTRGENLTRQLLAFSRTLPLDPTVIHPAEAVRAARDVLAGSLHVNIEFTVDVLDETWPVRVDKSELDLALVNLAVNSRNAMPNGGHIAITAENVRLEGNDAPEGKSGDYVAVSVADTGTGIAPDLLPRVVEPFFTTKDPDKGTGLGLSQVYDFAHRSGGTVQIASEVGRGTKITIFLPRSHSAIEATSPEDVTPYRAADDRTILVVEDNPDVKNVTVSLLEELGYDTVAVESAAEALDLLAKGRRINLVFTDVALPGKLDGLALARKVTHSYDNIPIVLTTGYTKAFDTEPEFPVLRKPYQIVALGRLIHQALYPFKVHAPH